jgi:hypothetical protein
MSIYTANLIIYTGTTFEQTFILEDDSGLIQLNGFNVISKLKKHPNSSSSTSFTGSVTDISGGRIKISLTPEETILLKPGKYLYDVILYKNGIGDRVVEGEVFVKKSITR